MLWSNNSKAAAAPGTIPNKSVEDGRRPPRSTPDEDVTAFTDPGLLTAEEEETDPGLLTVKEEETEENKGMTSYLNA